jgi:anti-anti-sigma factor
VKPVGPQIGQRESPIITAEVTPVLKEVGNSIGILLLDLRDVTFMASMGLGMCIAFRNLAVANGGKAILFGASEDLLGVPTMMRIDKLYSIAKSEDELRKLIAKA